MNLTATIKGIKYCPFLTRSLNTYNINNIRTAFDKDSAFLLEIKKDKKVAVSWWVSPKRTRSYPYARVYDTLNFDGKKITIIPIFKDEGKEGDRDFLQWDTISLMSLLGIYTIISYYCHAEKNAMFENKLTNQKFDIEHIKKEIKSLVSYKSDALHWNLAQVEIIGELAQKAFNAYERISKEIGVELHCRKKAQKRIERLKLGKNEFLKFSRNLAKQAQARESVTTQPKELTTGKKAKLTIQNYLGGSYFLTCDEVIIEKNNILLIESKHSQKFFLPSLEDIKDGLLKMMLFSNLYEVKVGDKNFNHKSILKLSSNQNFSKSKLSEKQINTLSILLKESRTNNFQVLIQTNDEKITELGDFLRK